MSSCTREAPLSLVTCLKWVSWTVIGLEAQRTASHYRLMVEQEFESKPSSVPRAHRVLWVSPEAGTLGLNSSCLT